MTENAAISLTKFQWYHNNKRGCQESKNQTAFQILPRNQFVLFDCDKLKQVSKIVNDRGDVQSATWCSGILKKKYTYDGKNDG